MALIIIALGYGPQHPLIIPVLAIPTLVLLRGCPMCWLVGLFQTISTRKYALRSSEENTR